MTQDDLIAQSYPPHTHTHWCTGFRATSRGHFASLSSRCLVLYWPTQIYARFFCLFNALSLTSQSCDPYGSFQDMCSYFRKGSGQAFHKAATTFHNSRGSITKPPSV